jgi:hypothetical protein
LCTPPGTTVARTRWRPAAEGGSQGADRILTARALPALQNYGTT